MSLDVSRMTAEDGIAALRSFPRRYRSALASVDPDQAEELAGRVGPGGHSALELVADTNRTLALVDRALHQTQSEEVPVVPAGVVDPGARQWEQPAGDQLSTALSELADAAVDLTTTAEAVGFGAWDRTATVAGGGGRTVTALDLLREGVRTASDNLRQVESTLQAVRR